MATPLFRQGASPNAKLYLYAVLCLCLIAVDSRIRSLETARQAISVVLYPIQQALLLPRSVMQSAAAWIEDQGELSRRAAALEKTAAQSALQSQQLAGIQQENAQLRQLMSLRQRSDITTLAADILYETREPVTRKVVIDRGLAHQVTPGMPVMDAQGLMGQVVRVFPLVSEVNLIIDKDQATPVQVVRNGLRAIAYGGVEGGQLEIRFMAANADIKEGDELYSSGIDGVYPPNLAVAKVVRIERSTAQGFARIVCAPLAGVSKNRHVVILTSKPVLPASPVIETLDDKKRPTAKRKAVVGAAAGAGG